MKIKESALRLPLENEIASLKSQIELLQQQVVSGVQDASKNSEVQDVNEEAVVYERHSEKKKADPEKCRDDKVLSDSERALKEKEQAVCLSLGAEISTLESQIHLLQQEIAVRDEKKEVNLDQSLVSKKEVEINQLKKLAEKEITQAESEKKKPEAGKKKVSESQKIAKTKILGLVGHVLLQLPFRVQRNPKSVIITDVCFELSKTPFSRIKESVIRSTKKLFGKQVLKHVNLGEYINSKVPSVKTLYSNKANGEVRPSSLKSLAHTMQLLL
ncbi:hypothetical protein POM88_026249 [Heracleum sosnowskyi]|uniref:Uncharacterized protein n=1 Tax=Heracleum sosnowskyi TaxID=360622 RepID=A0AAD8I6G7_9APIA|nr:hypothetical protein POM88_026249 [Heracleum sosnowskyi]